METASLCCLNALLVFSGCMIVLPSTALTSKTLVYLQMQKLAYALCKFIARTPLIRFLLSYKTFTTIAMYVQARFRKLGYTLRVEDACAVTLILFVVMLISVLLFSRSFAAMLLCAACCVCACPMFAHRLEQLHKTTLCHDMPDIFRMLGMALAAGQTFSQAIAYVGQHQPGEAGKAFQKASLKLRCGSSISEVLNDMAHTLQAPGVKFLITALFISQRTGAPLKALFRQSAQLVEQQEKFKKLLSVKTAQARLSIRVVSSLPLVLISVLSCISLDFQKGITRPAGLISLGIAAFLDFIALMIIRSLLKGAFHDI